MARVFSRIALLALLTVSCTVQRKMQTLVKERPSAMLQLPREAELPAGMDTAALSRTLRHRDTIEVTDAVTGRRMLLMNAVLDDDGEMVAHDEIVASYVTARFRNVAERFGKVSLEFQIVVPARMQDSRWQLRLHPRMEVLGDTLDLDDVIITGSAYRKAQLRGYQQYERFISRIVDDPSVFVDAYQLEMFLRRNLPGIYAFRNDTTEVSDEAFASAYGVTEREAVEHYTSRFRVAMNERRRAAGDRAFSRFVKSPIVTEGLRLDTVLVNTDGDFVYSYVQEVSAVRGLRKVDVMMHGEVCEQDRNIYTIPSTDPLTFYVSSLSAFVDPSERYLTKVVERRVEANTACYIEFSLGSSGIDEALGNNATEMGRIRRNILTLMENREFDIDSVIVTASSSPEGSRRYNEALSLRRSRSVSEHFSRYMNRVRDSLERESGFAVDFETGDVSAGTRLGEVEFKSRSSGENWAMLDVLVERDEQVGDADKVLYAQLASVSDLDERERRLQGLSSYRHIRESLYPRLRTVRFDFHLHRRGMLRDSVRTTVIDSAYMEGVQAIRDRDYGRAVTLLRLYNDYNAAVAFCAMGYDESALSILEGCERTDRVNYMLAVIWSRKGDFSRAVQHYLAACSQNPSYVHRGNLDPEIAFLIRTYSLDRIMTDDTSL